MNPHRVDVLDRADDHHVVAGVAHHFELELFPPEHAALDERGVHRRELERARDELLEFGAIVGDTPTGPAERERRAKDRRISGLGHDHQRLRHRRGSAPHGRSQADAVHRCSELGAVLGHLDRAGVRPDQLHAVTLERAIPRERHRHVQRGLPPHRWQQGVGALALDHLAHPFRCDRLDVRPVRELGVGHDRGRVRVHEHDRVALFLEGLHGLRARIVELGGLPDHDRARPQQQDAAEVSSLGHRARPEACRRASSAASSRSPPGAWRRPRPDGRCPPVASARRRPLEWAARPRGLRA